MLSYSFKLKDTDNETYYLAFYRLSFYRSIIFFIYQMKGFLKLLEMWREKYWRSPIWLFFSFFSQSDFFYRYLRETSVSEKGKYHKRIDKKRQLCLNTNFFQSSSYELSFSFAVFFYSSFYRWSSEREKKRERRNCTYIFFFSVGI